MTKQEAPTILNNTPVQPDGIQLRLKALADPSYRDFHSSLLPGTDNVLGVRTPELRRLAREIIRGDWQTFLQQNDRTWYENDILQGLVIAGAKMDAGERLLLVRDFLPRIENWAVCDIFCNTLKDAKKYPELYREFLRPYFSSEKPYEIRFATVMYLSHFCSPEYAEEAFAYFDGVTSEHYYVRMAVAWSVSVYFVHAQAQTLAYLRNNRLDDWTYNKALQKILESLRVSSEMKAQIRLMKRRAERRR